MLVGMVLGGFGSVMLCVQGVAVCYVSVMRGFFVIAVLMVFGGSPMMLGRVFMMLRGFLMMIDVVFGHGILSGGAEVSSIALIRE